MRPKFVLLLAAMAPVPALASETQEKIAGWTIEERRNPAEPRDYSIRLSKAAGGVELVVKRSAIKGRDTSLLLGDCMNVGSGTDPSALSVAQQIQSIRETAASGYESNHEGCNLPPKMSPALLSGFDEAYRAMDARYRANRPPAAALDRTQAAGGWAVEDRKDESNADEPGHRLITLTKTQGDLRIAYTLDVNLFFDSMFFTRNRFAARYADCRREEDLLSTDKEGGAEAAVRKAEVAKALRDLQTDCQLSAATATAMLSDFAPAFQIAAGWARKHLADRAALVKVADAYEDSLAGESYAGAYSSGSGDAAEDAASAAADAADDDAGIANVAADAAEAATEAPTRPRKKRAR